ncbi:hypothetical protein Kpho02_70760 [Kitasatospora phosalacinea]|uniref:Tetratricopeptide repeat protein n=1 Tax=Kitasatospora phosalacinea TaxID=2065 RepID=A0A9W6V3U8_9ACTN|nr:hypothetical protein [Kitasatospora phosalacinea]GLW74779.1 hypothetical protein Kpho02_70760 [Kitasatospora phosalacinea]
MGLFSGRRRARAENALRQAELVAAGPAPWRAGREARRAVEHCTAVFGPGAEATARARTLVAGALRAAGKLDGAEAELRSALAVVAPDSASDGTLRGELAVVLELGGRAAEAEQEARRVLAAGHGTWETRQWLAIAVGSSGRHREAAELFAEAAGHALDLPGGGTHSCKLRSDRLAQLVFLGRFAEVDEQAVELRARAARLSGPAGLLVPVAVDNNRALGLVLRGRPEEAEPLLRKGLRTVAGRGRFAVVLQVNLSRALLARGRVAEAADAVAAARTLTGGVQVLPVHDRTALAHAEAAVLLARNELAGAERRARTALPHLAPAHHRALELRTLLGTAELRRGSGSDTLTAVLADWQTHFGPDHHGAAVARTALTAGG